MQTQTHRNWGTDTKAHKTLKYIDTLQHAYSGTHSHFGTHKHWDIQTLTDNRTYSPLGLAIDTRTHRH